MPWPKSGREEFKPMPLSLPVVINVSTFGLSLFVVINVSAFGFYAESYAFLIEPTRTEAHFFPVVLISAMLPLLSLTPLRSL